MSDLLIRDVLVIDGTGESPYQGDVSVRAGRIEAVGKLTANGAQVVDGAGLALAPGIIDSHTHYDAQITWDAWTTPSVSLGVTSLVMGNCGFGIAPCWEKDRAITLANLTQVEGMSLEALTEGTQWSFTSFAEYLNFLESNRVGPNVACYCGHSSLRMHVMGEAAAERLATDDEVEKMKTLLLDALRAGACGFSTSTFEGHNGLGGRPMPSRLADESEIMSLTKVLGMHGSGNFMLTKGSKTTMKFLESLATESGRPVMVAALLVDNLNPDRIFRELDAIQAATERGNSMIGQVSCSPMIMDFKLDSAYPMEILDTWQQVIPIYADHERLSAIYANNSFRDGVRSDLKRDVAVREYTPQFDRIHIIETNDSKYASYIGKTIEEVAVATGVDPLDWFLDCGIESGFDVKFSAEILNVDEELVSGALLHPASNVSLSDAGAHLTLFCDAGFGLHVLGHWVRDRGAFELSEAVRMVSSAQANAFGLIDRGVIKPGYHADLLLFDPETIGRSSRYLVSDLPAGASRFTTDPIGIHGTWINGIQVADESGLLDVVPPGQVLREFH